MRMLAGVICALQFWGALSYVIRACKADPNPTPVPYDNLWALRFALILTAGGDAWLGWMVYHYVL